MKTVVTNRFAAFEEKVCDEKMQRQDDLKEMLDESFPKEAMGNYSKRKMKFEKCPKKMRALNLFEKRTQVQANQGETKELYPVTESGKQSDWQWIKGLRLGCLCVYW